MTAHQVILYIDMTFLRVICKKAHKDNFERKPYIKHHATTCTTHFLVSIWLFSQAKRKEEEHGGAAWYRYKIVAEACKGSKRNDILPHHWIDDTHTRAHGTLLIYSFQNYPALHLSICAMLHHYAYLHWDVKKEDDSKNLHSKMTRSSVQNSTK